MQDAEVSTATRFADRYALIDRLHAGAASEVWLAEDTRAGIAVALKALGRASGERDPLRVAFRREYDIARGLNHPHTVRVLSWLDGERPAYAMQYVDGTDFSDLVGRPFEVWAPPLLVIADTLVYWHRKGVVHGDLKPANLLLDRRGVAYLADFGSAATVHGDAPAGRGGSPAYAGPEQRAGDPPDPGDDVFSLARVISELATGDPAGGAPAELPTALRRWIDAAGEPRDKRPTTAALCDVLSTLGVTRGQVDLKSLGVTLRRPASSVAGGIAEARDDALPHGAFERPTGAGDAQGGIRPRTVVIGLLAIVLFGVLFTQALRWLGDRGAEQGEPAVETAPEAAGEAATSGPEPGDEPETAEATEAIDAPVDDAERVAQRRAADEAVARLISVVDVLERRGVDIWGGAHP